MPDFEMEPRFTIWDGSEWLDVTADVRLSEDQVITGGRPDEGSRTDPGTLALRLNNGASKITGGVGRYSPRNPLSDLYGLIGRNTPIRMELRESVPHMQLGSAIGSQASVASTSALDVTGDIDVRVDVALDALPAQGADFALSDTNLIARYDTGANQRAFRLILTGSGQLWFSWSPDGTTPLSSFSSEPVPAVSGQRFAARATLDVNNGAGGWTLTFYVAPTLAGPWRQLGVQRTGTGTTSIHAPTGVPLNIGGMQPELAQGAGRWYGAEVRSGIGGTAVANPDFTALADGTTAFTDSAGRSWALAGDAEVTPYTRVFHGEVNSWPSRWDVSGVDVYVPLAASGILRRLSQGQKPLESTLRRRIPSYAPLAYWPMELDGGTRRNRRAASPVDGVNPMSTAGLDWAADSTLPGSNPLPKIAEGAYLNARIPAPESKLAPASWSVEFVYLMPQAPASTRSLVWVTSTGTVRVWQILYGPPSGSFDLTCRIIGSDADGTEIVNQLIGLGDDVLNAWVRQRLTLTQDSGNVDWELRWLKVGSTAGIFDGTFSGTIGRPTAVKSPESYHADIAGVSLGHMSAWLPADNAGDAFNFADHGFSGETAVDRLRRLAEEEELPLSVAGVSSQSAVMGPQRPASLLELLQECVDTDGGLLTERAESVGLQYQARHLRYNQAPRLALDYAAGHIAPPLDPQDDDLATRNDITVTSPGGSSARAVLREGTLSVRQPPNGVGVYDEEISRNLDNDGDLELHANWLLHLGTFDGIRYPALTLNMANPRMSEFADDLLSVRPGDRITVENPPAWMPPDTIDLLVEGVSQTVNQFDHLVEFNCAPAGPWNVGEVAAADAADDTAPVRADTDGSELAGDIGTADTAIFVHSHTGPAWATSAGPSVTAAAGDLPWDVKIGGERVTATAVEPAVWDTFGRIGAAGWGTTPSGTALPWVLSGGTAGERSVDGAAGLVAVADTSAVRFQFVNLTTTDSELLTAVTVPALATGGSLRAGLVFRISGANYYQVRANFTTSGSVGVDVVNSGTVVESISATGKQYTAGSKWWLRCRIDGQNVVGKVWPNGSPEPGWQIAETMTGSTIASGLVGISAARASGNTNASPSFAFDDFSVITPQRWTVQRSRNGIEKAHNAGGDVRLADPTIAAL